MTIRKQQNIITLHANNTLVTINIRGQVKKYGCTR